MSLKKVTTNVTYKVPAWSYCRLLQEGSLTKESKNLCRFCIKEGKSYRCALYNMPLAIEEGVMPVKAPQCAKATAGFKSVVEDIPDDNLTVIDPKIVMKAAIDEYTKVYKKLLGQGYPAAIADKATREYLIGGN